MNKQELIDFETDIKNEFVQAKILAPIHLSDGNEDQLIQIFEDIPSKDWDRPDMVERTNNDG
mgnify:CR=1 FL=1